MNENRFVAVGRIERLIPSIRGLTLVIGGAGPVKGLVVIELRDSALVALVSNPATGFAVGDIVSASGRLELDVETLQNIAVAAPDGVSRICRTQSPRSATQNPSIIGAALPNAAIGRNPSGDHLNSPLGIAQPQSSDASIPWFEHEVHHYLNGKPIELDDIPS